MTDLAVVMEAHRDLAINVSRLVAEVTSLQRQTTGSSVLAENLNKFQLQLEQTNNEEKKRLQVNYLYLGETNKVSDLATPNIGTSCVL